MRVAAIQHDIVWEDPAANFARLDPQITAAAAAGARLVVLTEMFATGFSMNTAVTGEEPGGPSTAFLVDQARHHDLWTCATIPERTAGYPLPTNTCVLVGPDGTVHRYRKIHPFSYSGEDEHFAAGSDFCTVDLEGLRVTLFVCYDLRFADEFWATAAGTDCYLVPANWPAARREHWTTLLRARAIENQAYVVGVNRVGKAGNGMPYAGDSRVVDPSGAVLAGAAEQEALLVTDVEGSTVAATRERYPFARDRR